MSDALRLLAPFEWRGQVYPVSARDYGFRHEGSPVSIQYRDGQLYDMTGAQSPTYRYTIPMRQDIAIGTYKNLFTEALPILFAAMRDRSTGLLVDPIHGPAKCKPQTYAESLNLGMRDGIDLEVEMVESPDLTDEDEVFKPLSAEGLTSDAGALDEEIQRVDWQQEPSPEPTVDILDAISGVGAQIDANVGKFNSGLHKYAFQMEKIEAQAKRLENPDGWQIARSARRNRAAALKLAERTRDPSKRVVRVLVKYGKTISGAAAEAGMTVQELIRLNPSLAALGHVPAGTPLYTLKTSG
jgi:hypothetical protein